MESTKANFVVERTYLAIYWLRVTIFIFGMEVVYTLIWLRKQQKDRKKDSIEKNALEKIENETDDQEDQMQKDVKKPK